MIGGTNSIVSAISDSTGGYFCVLALAILFLWLRPRGIHARSERRASRSPRASSRSRAAAAASVGDFWAYQLGLLYLYAIAALGVGLCWGRAGFLPLGQGLFFGLPAYLSGLALIAFEQSLVAACCCCRSPRWPRALLAFGIGTLVFRRQGESGPYFSMITLALRCSATRSRTTGSR